MIFRRFSPECEIVIKMETYKKIINRHRVKISASDEWKFKKDIDEGEQAIMKYLYAKLETTFWCS